MQLGRPRRGRHGHLRGDQPRRRGLVRTGDTRERSPGRRSNVGRAAPARERGQSGRAWCGARGRGRAPAFAPRAPGPRPSPSRPPPPCTRTACPVRARWASVATDGEGNAHVVWLDGRAARTARGRAARHAAGHPPRDRASRRQPRRGHRRDRRLLLLQDRGRHRSRRHRLRRLAAHLPHQPARHRGGALDRRRQDVLLARPGQRGWMADRGLSRRRARPGRRRGGRPAHRVADDDHGAARGEGHLLQLFHRRRPHVRAAAAASMPRTWARPIPRSPPEAAGSPSSGTRRVRRDGPASARCRRVRSGPRGFPSSGP